MLTIVANIERLLVQNISTCIFFETRCIQPFENLSLTAVTIFTILLHEDNNNDDDDNNNKNNRTKNRTVKQIFISLPI